MEIRFSQNPLILPFTVDEPNWLFVTDQSGLGVRYDLIDENTVEVQFVDPGTILNISYRPLGIFNYDQPIRRLCNQLEEVARFSPERIRARRPDPLTDTGFIPLRLAPLDCHVYQTDEDVASLTTDQITGRSYYSRTGQWNIATKNTTFIRVLFNITPTVINARHQEVPLIDRRDGVFQVDINNEAFLVCIPII